MDPKIAKNEFYKALFKTFDRGLMAALEKVKGDLVASLEKTEEKLNRCEKSLQEVARQLVHKTQRDLDFADKLVQKEMRSKVLMSDWTCKFLAESKDDALNPITFAFTRFSLNICVSFSELGPARILECNVHRQLVDYMAFPSDLVAGPAIMALVHISLYDELKPAIVLVGALPRVLRVMKDSTSKPALCQCCKLLGSLALHFPNKSQIVNSGCLHGLLDLILGYGKEIDDHIQYAALTAVVNVTMGNDASRTLMIELSGIRPAIAAIQVSTNDKCILRAIMVLANVAYCNSFTSGKILNEGGHLVLLELLQAGDIIRQGDIARAAITALYNLCNNDTTQTFVACTKGLCEAVVRICEHAKDPLLVADSATFLLAIMFDNQANKCRVASKGACPVLIKQIACYALLEGNEYNFCTERLAYALASMLIHDSHHEQMHAIGGLDEISRLCKKSNNSRVLRSLSQILSAMTPSPDAIVRFHSDLYTPPIERVGALPILRKCKFNGFGEFPVLPDWLVKTMAYLEMKDDDLRQQPLWVKSEFVDKLTFAKEFLLDIEPDADVLNDVNCRGLVMSTF